MQSTACMCPSHVGARLARYNKKQRNSNMLLLYPLLLCMHAGPKGLAASSWSADIGVDRSYHSLGVYYYGGGP